MTIPIACDLHDYLEIACLYQYKVRLQLNDNQTVEGKAIDVVIVDKCEYLVIDNGQRHQIALKRLVKLTALSPNAKFGEIQF